MRSLEIESLEFGRICRDNLSPLHPPPDRPAGRALIIPFGEFKKLLTRREIIFGFSVARRASL